MFNKTLNTASKPVLQKRHKPQRKAFGSMGTTYVLGVFNDNFFKEAAILIAFAAGMGHLQGAIIAYFSLPFILFSAYAGFFADRFSKRRVIVASKYMELAAMTLGAIGIWLGQFNLILAMVFVMALQSTLFSPALNGAIPELFKPRQVPRVNALIKMITTLAIILGIVAAGLVLDIPAENTGGIFGGTTGVALAIIAVALIGIPVAYRIPRTPNKSGTVPFPWTGPLASVRHSVAIRKQPRLFKALLASTFFYFSSTFVLAAIHALCLDTLGYSNTFTSGLTALLAIGVTSGSLISIALSKRYDFEQIFTPACIFFGLALMVSSLAGYVDAIATQLHLGITLLLAGMLGGMFLIPVLTFIQVTPASHEKGKVLGVNNFLDFIGIFVAGKLFETLHPALSARQLLALIGGVAIVNAVSFAYFQPKDQPQTPQSEVRHV